MKDICVDYNCVYYLTVDCVGICYALFLWLYVSSILYYIIHCVMFNMIYIFWLYISH